MARLSIPAPGLVGFALAASVCVSSIALGQCTSATLGAASVYTFRQCLPPCQCVIAPETGPLTGALEVCFDHTDGTTNYYNVTADLTGTPTTGPNAHLTGTGVFTYGASVQQLTLDLTPDGGTSSHYDSGQVAVGSVSPPSISLTVQTTVQSCSQHVLAIAATASCAADFNGDGHLSVQDIFDFLDAWFAGAPDADFNGVNGITVQDIFDFLNAWFAGCP